jgi:hypothetical protein
MHNRQCLALRSGFLLLAALLLPLLAAEAQLHASNRSKHMSPASPPTVDVPTNATLDYTGHAWGCQHGYQRAGNECLVLHMPANAAIDYTGHAWECQQGYRRVGDACENMTALPKTAMYSSSAVQESRVNPPQQNDAKEAIRHIQEQLQQAGFDPGPLDGILGPRTMKALDRSLATR